MTEQELIDEGYIEGKKTFKYYSKKCGDEFNWENVHKAMIAVGWVWSFGYDRLGMENEGIPSLETIKNHGYALLKEAYDAGKGQISAGGFSAGWDSGELFLTFTLEEWSV